MPERAPLEVGCNRPHHQRSLTVMAWHKRTNCEGAIVVKVEPMGSVGSRGAIPSWTSGGTEAHECDFAELRHCHCPCLIMKPILWTNTAMPPPQGHLPRDHCTVHWVRALTSGGNKSSRLP